MQIDWWTLVLQTVNFLVLVWLLTRFLYRPVRTIIAERQARADRAIDEAEAKSRAAEAARARADAERRALEAQRRELETALHRETQEETERILQAARAEAATIVERAKHRVQAERVQALDTVKQELAALSADLAARLLRRHGANGAGSTAIGEIDRFLNDMPAARRRELRDSLVTAGEPVEVVTAGPLSHTDRSAWNDAIRRWFEQAGDTRFRDDPALVGGVLMRLPHAELDFTWARELRDAERQLLEPSR